MYKFASRPMKRRTGPKRGHTTPKKLGPPGENDLVVNLANANLLLRRTIKELRLPHNDLGVLGILVPQWLEKSIKMYYHGIGNEMCDSLEEWLHKLHGKK